LTFFPKKSRNKNVLLFVFGLIVNYRLSFFSNVIVIFLFFVFISNGFDVFLGRMTSLGRVTSLVLVVSSFLAIVFEKQSSTTDDDATKLFREIS